MWQVIRRLGSKSCISENIATTPLHYMSIGMIPFRAFYKYDATSFIDLVIVDSN